MQDTTSIVIASISAWINQYDRSLYLLLYLMMIFKHLFTYDQGEFANVDYFGKWRYHGKFFRICRIPFSDMTLSQLSFCILSAILVVFGDRMPHFVGMLLLSSLQLCGYLSTILFVSSDQDSALAVRETLECTAVIYATLNILPKEVRAGLCYWRHLYLTLTLVSSFLWVVSMMQNTFNRSYLADILPLGGFCATSLIILGLKAIGVPSTLTDRYDMLLNMFNLLWVFISTITLYSQLFTEVPASTDHKYRPWYWFARNDCRLGCYLEFIPFIPRMAWVYSILSCISTMYTFNLLSSWLGEFESPEQITGEYSGRGVMEGRNLDYWAYFMAAFVLVGYSYIHLYVYLPVKRAYRRLHNLTNDDVTSDDGAKDDGASDDVVSVSSADDPYWKFYFPASRYRENVSTILIFGDWILLYFASMLMSFGCSIPGDLIVVSLLLLEMAGYIATISLAPVFRSSDMSRYILTHVSIHSAFLNVLPPQSKYCLSQCKNLFLILSELTAKVFFILQTYSMNKMLNNATLYLMLCALMVAEGLGAVMVLGYLNNGKVIGKILLKEVTTYLYGYDCGCFFVSVCFEIGYSILSERYFPVFFEKFCRIAVGSIMFHLGPMLMYSLLSTWYLQHENNTGQQKQYYI